MSTRVAPNATFISAYQAYKAKSADPQIRSSASVVLSAADTLNRAQQFEDLAVAGFQQAQKAGTAPDASGQQQPLSYWQSQVANSETSRKATWQDLRSDESSFWSQLNKSLNPTGQPPAAGASMEQQQVYNTLQNYVNDPLYTSQGRMPADYAKAGA